MNLALALAPELTLSTCLVASLIAAALNKNKSTLAAGIVGLVATFVGLHLTTTASVAQAASLGLERDGMGLALSSLVVLGALTALCALASIGSVHTRADLVPLMLGATLGAITLCFAQTLELLFLGFEILSLASYALVALRNFNKAGEAALKYVLYGGVSSGIFLLGVSYFFGATGATHLSRIAHVHQGYEGVAAVAVVLMIAGVCYKMGLAPFHMWVADVYEGASSTVVAFFSVVPKIGGFALLARLWLAVLQPTVPDSVRTTCLVSLGLAGALSMVVGGMAALTQGNLKRMLAYSTVAHAGYLCAVLAVPSSYSLMSAVLYLATYYAMSMGAFFVCQYLETQSAGGANASISDIRGLFSPLPLWGFAATLFLLGLSGLPLTAGFMGKIYVFIALAQGGNWGSWTLLGLSLVATLLGFAYSLRVIRAIALPPLEGLPFVQPSYFASGLVGVMLLITLGLGIFWTPVLDLTHHFIDDYRRPAQAAPLALLGAHP